MTGACGKTGQATVAELLAHGHEVVAVDVAAGHDLDIAVEQVDLADARGVLEVLDGVEAVVHLANIPGPGVRPPVETFNTNTTVNFNVFSSAPEVGVRHVVWASSAATLGVPFDVPPRYAPVDEDHYPLPTTAYALSKVVGETIAAHVAAWSGIPFVALRFSHIVGPDDYGDLASQADDPAAYRWSLWSYLDVRDAAAACRLALDAPVDGAASFVIAAADTVAAHPSAELLHQLFPSTPLNRELGDFESLLSIDRARTVLGFEPRHSWRDAANPS